MLLPVVKFYLEVDQRKFPFLSFRLKKVFPLDQLCYARPVLQTLKVKLKVVIIGIFIWKYLHFLLFLVYCSKQYFLVLQTLKVKLKVVIIGIFIWKYLHFLLFLVYCSKQYFVNVTKCTWNTQKQIFFLNGQESGLE